MFIPIFIAILVGLISPNSQTANSGSNGTVYVSNSSGDEGDPGTDPGTETGDDDDTGISGPGAGGPGGNSGQNPPPKP